MARAVRKKELTAEERLTAALVSEEKQPYNEYKMSPTSISGGGKLLTGGELISPASLKHQEEDLSSTNLEQRCYNTQEGLNSNPHLKWGCSDFQPPS